MKKKRKGKLFYGGAGALTAGGAGAGFVGFKSRMHALHFSKSGSPSSPVTQKSSFFDKVLFRKKYHDDFDRGFKEFARKSYKKAKGKSVLNQDSLYKSYASKHAKKGRRLKNLSRGAAGLFVLGTGMLAVDQIRRRRRRH